MSYVREAGGADPGEGLGPPSSRRIRKLPFRCAITPFLSPSHPMTALSAIAAAIDDDIAALSISVNKNAIVSLLPAVLVDIVRHCASN